MKVELPLEVCDTIVDFVHAVDEEDFSRPLDMEDSEHGPPPYQNIHRCALVCRAWLRRSRHRSFRRITLVNIGGRKGLFAAPPILHHPLCTFLQDVVEVHILHGQASSCLDDMWKDLLAAQWSVTFDALAMLPNVHHLIFSDARFDYLFEARLDPIPSLGSNITRLELHGGSLECLSDISTLIAQSPGLKDLCIYTSVESCDWTIFPPQDTKQDPFHANPSVQLSSLSVLVLEAADYAQLISWEAAINLTSLAIQVDVNRQDEALEQQKFCHLLDLSRHLQLKRLEFDFWADHGSPARVRPHFAATLYIPLLLTRVTSENIRVVEFSATLRRWESLQTAADWKGIAEALRRPVYARLEKIVITLKKRGTLFFNTGEMDGCRAWIQDNLVDRFRFVAEYRFTLDPSWTTNITWTGSAPRIPHTISGILRPQG